LTRLLLSLAVAKFVCLYATYSLIAVPQKPLVPDFPSLSTRRHLSNTKTKVYALFQSTKRFAKKKNRIYSIILCNSLFFRKLKDKKIFSTNVNLFV